MRLPRLAMDCVITWFSKCTGTFTPIVSRDVLPSSMSMSPSSSSLSRDPSLEARECAHSPDAPRPLPSPPDPPMPGPPKSAPEAVDAPKPPASSSSCCWSCSLTRLRMRRAPVSRSTRISTCATISAPICRSMPRPSVGAGNSSPRPCCGSSDWSPSAGSADPGGLSAVKREGSSPRSTARSSALISASAWRCELSSFTSTALSTTTSLFTSQHLISASALYTEKLAPRELLLAAPEACCRCRCCADRGCSSDTRISRRDSASSSFHSSLSSSSSPNPYSSSPCRKSSPSPTMTFTSYLLPDRSNPSLLPLCRELAEEPAMLFRRSLVGEDLPCWCDADCCCRGTPALLCRPPERMALSRSTCAAEELLRSGLPRSSGDPSLLSSPAACLRRS
mmetsp:Transcript_4354/g.9770  ORF Transcript_4354/g.9770 Transcript_4354/m.9770 type:complete len:393 (-) Transcript_4354:823-2001(-)